MCVIQLCAKIYGSPSIFEVYANASRRTRDLELNVFTRWGLKSFGLLTEKTVAISPEQSGQGSAH